MKRTQIFLDDDIYKFLKEESKKTGKTISKLIREKLRKEIKQNSENLLKNMQHIAGIWSYQMEDVDNFIRNLRKGERSDSF